MNNLRSDNIEGFSANAEGDVNRLRSQVDLFWQKEIKCYRQFGLEDGMHVLECGSGAGHVMEKLLKECPGCLATAVEMDPCLVDVLKERLSGRCDISQQSIMDLEFASESFDFVITRLVLEHLLDPLGAVREVYRVLKPGGKAVFIDNDFDIHLRTHPEIPELKELYGAYCRLRGAEGGNPRIGRELPSLLKRCGFARVDFDVLCAHSSVTGDDMLFKSEGVGIPSQLVKGGYLPAKILDQLAVNWHRVLKHEHHSIFRQLFVSGGEKQVNNTVDNPGWRQRQGEAEAPLGLELQAPSPEMVDRQQVLTALPGERRTVVKRYVLGHVAKALSLSGEAMDGETRVNDLGFDSLMAVEVMDNVESELGVSLSMMDFFEGQSSSDIAVILHDRLFSNEPNDSVRVEALDGETPNSASHGNEAYTRIGDGDEIGAWEEGDI